MYSEVSTKRIYVKPFCEVIPVEVESGFLYTSFHGQHNPAHHGTVPEEDSGGGQHNPGHHGTGPTGAKMFRLSGDEDELMPVGRSGYSPWDD